MTDTGIFRTTIGVEHITENGVITELPDTLVDTGSEFTWVPATILEALGIPRRRRQGFELADGSVITRDMGHAMVHAAGTVIPDLVVFAEPTDTTLMGVHTIEGMNLKIDFARRELVPAGPVITAAAA